jgi:hypothetical protein
MPPPADRTHVSDATIITWKERVERTSGALSPRRASPAPVFDLRIDAYRRNTASEGHSPSVETHGTVILVRTTGPSSVAVQEALAFVVSVQ